MIYLENNQKKTLYLVRHSITDWNEKDILMGHKDIPLNSKGINLLEDIKDSLHLSVLQTVIYSSDLCRAKQTTAILFPGMDVSFTNLLRERNCAFFEGKKKSAISAQEFNLIKNNFASSDFENDISMEKRLLKFIGLLKNKNKTYIGVTHLGVIKLINKKILPGINIFEKKINDFLFTIYKYEFMSFQ